jgi:PAS domain S-box-containing protein
VGDAAQDLLGMTADELQRDPMRLWNAIHPEDRASWDAAVAHAAATLEPLQWEGRVDLASGEEKLIEARARGQRLPEGASLWSGLLMDVTERRRSAARLEESEQRFRSLFELHPDAVFALDPEGRFTSVNPNSERVGGYRPEELVGQPFAPILVPEHLEQALARFSAALLGEVQLPHELTIRHKSGQWVEVSVTTVPIVVGGRVVGVFGMARDLTAQHALEAKLRQAQKMEAIGRLAGGVAHDFNNLLMAILATSEILLDETTGRRCREDVQIIRETAERATVLTRQLLDFSRQQTVQPRPIDVNSVMRNTGRMLRRTLGDGITVILDLEAGLVRVLADRGQLEQAVVNLVLNARDAMPHGGRLSLRSRNVVVDEAAARQHQGLGAGTYVAIVVEDTGVGIAPELQQRIFEPFVTTKPVGQGSGLGLATVFGLVEQWHGWIEVQSAPGKGAIFTMYLPHHPTESRPASPPPGEQVARRDETILVVDDETAVRKSIRRMLAWKGYTVLEAADGADALRMLDHMPGRVNLVLTDLVMPVLDGRGLIAALRQRSDAPGIIAMSGFDREAAMRGEPLPADVPFLQKPFTSDQLFRTVRKTLGIE